MKFNQLELDLLKRSLLVYGGQYGLHGIPEFEKLVSKIDRIQHSPATLKRITHEDSPTWTELHQGDSVHADS